MSISRKGKPAHNKGKKGKPAHNKGKKSSQESKDKISETFRIKRFNKIIESYSK